MLLLQGKEGTMRVTILGFFLLIGLSVNGQEQLLLMNGKQFYGVSLDTSGVKIQFDIARKGGKFKTKSIYRDDVFSIVYSDSTEKIFFYPDMYFIDEYTIDNMKMVVMGKMDARYRFKSKWVIPVGIGVSGLAAYLMNGSVYSLFIPIIYTGLVQIPIVRVQKESISNPDFIGNDFYAEGYDRGARSKRTKQALISSIVGVAAGILIQQATN